MQRTSLRQRTVVIAQYGWEISIVRAVELQSGYRLQATAEASAEAAFPVPPRGWIPPIAGEMSRSDKGGAGPAGPHDTLQPPDESIIMGYYTLKK